MMPPSRKHPSFLLALLTLLPSSYLSQSPSASSSSPTSPKFPSQTAFETYIGASCPHLFPFYTCCNAFCPTCIFANLCPCTEQELSMCKQIDDWSGNEEEEGFESYVSPFRDNGEGSSSQSEPPNLTSSFNPSTGGTITLTGYQTFSLHYTFSPPYLQLHSPNPTLHHKATLLTQTLTSLQPHHPSPISYADLGTSNGFLLHVASLNSASPILGLDHDSEYTKNVKASISTLHDYYSPLVPPLISPTILTGNLENQPSNLADVVSCFALLHWAYSATSSYRSLDAVIKHLSSLGKIVTIIEWIDIDDDAVRYLKHEEINGGGEGYSFELFMEGMVRWCGGVEDLGGEEGRESRRTYLCWREKRGE